MMGYRLCVANPKNWEIVKEKLKWGISGRYAITLETYLSAIS